MGRRSLPIALGAVCLTLALAAAPRPAGALAWPDVSDEIEAGLRAPNPATRRAAAERIATVGPGSGPKLVELALRDADAEVRIAGARAAIRLRLAAVVDTTTPWLLERDVRLRVAACEVLEAMPTSKAVTALARALTDTESPLVRGAAAEALGAYRGPEAVPPLMGRLDDPSPQVRAQVMRALGAHRDARAVVPLIGKVQDTAAEVRQAAAHALAELGDARALQTLLALVRDPVPEVRIEALAALGRLRNDAATPTVLPLASERHLQVRAAAIRCLGEIGSRAAIAGLVALLGQGDDALPGAERTPVKQALVTLGERARGDVAAVLDTTGSPVRAAAAAAVLGAMRSKGDAPRIASALRRGILEPRAALAGLAGTGSAEHVAIALEFLTDPSPEVRDAAIRCASVLLSPAKPDGRAVEPIVFALRARGLSVAERAALATLLGKTGAPRAAAPLVALLGAGEPALRIAAVEALGEIGPSEPGATNFADAPLLELLRAPEARLRTAAAVAISRSGGERALQELTALVDGGDGVDRAAVLIALGGVAARASTPALADRLHRSLALAAGGDRDALLLALGRASGVTPTLTTLVTEGDDDDRRCLATVVGSADVPARGSLLLALLADADGDTQAQAAWSAAAFPPELVREPLARLVRSPRIDVAANAVAGLSRSDAWPATAFCPLLGDARALVRANALAALAARRSDCDGRAATLLTSDPAPEVRANAARVLAALATASAREALATCTRSERTARVAAQCVAAPRGAASRRPEPGLAFVVPFGAAAPRGRTPYVLELADGMHRSGLSDRRGALFEATGLDADVVLRRPTAP